MQLPLGFRYSGVRANIKKSGLPDLALVVTEEPATAAGVYTQNIVRAASIDWNRAITPPENFKEAVYGKLSERALKASAIIAIVMKRDEKESLPEVEEIAAVSAAVQNMYITSSAYGLAAYWGSGGLTYTQAMKDFLKIGEKDICMGLFMVGYPDVEWPMRTERLSRDEISEWIEE
jgi:nitroreductase